MRGLRIAMPMPSGLPAGWKVFIIGPDIDNEILFKLTDQYGDNVAKLFLRAYDSDTWQVSWAKVTKHKDGGWGAYLYEQAMKWVSAAGHHMVSDNTISDDAVRVWDKYHEREDVEKLPVRREKPPVKLNPGKLEISDPRLEQSLQYKYRLKNGCWAKKSEPTERKIRLKIPMSNLYMLNRWGHPLNAQRLQYQLDFGSESPPIQVNLGTVYEKNMANYVHSYDPQDQDEDSAQFVPPSQDDQHPLYFVDDGHHRTRATQLRGEPLIDAIVTVPEVPYYLSEDKKKLYEEELSAAVKKLESLQIQTVG